MTAPNASGDLLLAPGTWTLDPDESTIGFRIFAMPPAKGKFTQAEGKLIVDDNHSGSVTASIAVDSLKTGLGLRDKHLKSSHFFDAANHPTITFQSDRITQENDDIRLRGTLSMRGNRRPVELAGKVVTTGDGGVRLKLNGEINRRDFGVAWMGMDRLMFSNRVKLNLDLLARAV